tara:strand:- start:383 stop:799 length:417 start_codon:yes stop_codon:yes gene_type:complete
VSKRKEKLKGIAKGSKTDQWMGDYSAKGEYIEKGGMMGEGDIYKDEEVKVTVEGKGKKAKQVKKSTQDKTTSKNKSGKIVTALTYPTAKSWFNSVLSDKSLTPKMSGNEKGFMYGGKIYAIGKGAKGENIPSDTETKV